MRVLEIRKKQPIPIHNLIRLLEEANLNDDIDNKLKQLLINLNPFYIKARYPDYKERLSQSIDKEFTERTINKTEEFISWIKLKID